MKLTIQKILICLLSLILSITACVFGMYMVFKANMHLGYRILFVAVFLLNPVAIIFMIRFMFKKPVPKEDAAGGAEEAKKKKKRPFFGKKDAEENEAIDLPETEDELPQADTSYSGSSYSGASYSGTADYEPADSDSLGTEESYPASSHNAQTFSDSSVSDSFANSSLDDVPTLDDLEEQPMDRSVGQITEKSVDSVKKISLIRKKRPTDGK